VQTDDIYVYFSCSVRVHMIMFRVMNMIYVSLVTLNFVHRFPAYIPLLPALLES
jgi:hypothetical protein